MSEHLDEFVARVKDEIIEDVLWGTVPIFVTTYSDLHDFVDANCYGGFCDEPAPDHLEELKRQKEPWEDTYLSQALMDFANEVTSAVNDWIEAGGLFDSIRGMWEHDPTAIRQRQFDWRASRRH